MLTKYLVIFQLSKDAVIYVNTRTGLDKFHCDDFNVIHALHWGLFNSWEHKTQCNTNPSYRRNSEEQRTLSHFRQHCVTLITTVCYSYHHTVLLLSPHCVTLITTVCYFYHHTVLLLSPQCVTFITTLCYSYHHTALLLSPHYVTLITILLLVSPHCYSYHHTVTYHHSVLLLSPQCVTFITTLCYSYHHNVLR
jgi:hypothetical protein